MRYFAHLSYNGKNYNGWQIQKNSTSTIQGIIEESLYTISRIKTPIVGCGRTDTGVHALNYFIHFDSLFDWIGLEYKLNRVLPSDIVVFKICQVTEGDHARFDAISRAYEYRLHTFKNAFINDVSYYYKRGDLDINKANEVCTLLKNYQEFFPFCKSRSGVEHYKCELTRALWKETRAGEYVLEVESNRFLRGMVRLIVGASILTSEGKIGLQQIRESMDKQCLMPKSLSAPPEGLALTKILYPERLMTLFDFA